MSPPKPNEKARSGFEKARKLLDQATEAFHAAHGGDAPDRAAQFDGHMATLQMVVDHAEHHVVNVVPFLPSDEDSAEAPHYLDRES